MSTYKLALIIKNPANEEEFLMVHQPRPPRFGIPEYDSYVDSDLFDLPSVQFSLISEFHSQIELEGAELCDKLDLRQFDLGLALTQVSEQVGIGRLDEGKWKFWKYVEEPEFGPGPPINTVFISGGLTVFEGEACQWMSFPACIKCLLDAKQDSLRIGPLVVNGFLHDSRHSKWDFLQNFRCQEYSPGVMLVPMESRTRKPFRTTNLIVIAPEFAASSPNGDPSFVHGDAMIVDPGCNFQFEQELADIVAALPRKLIVFVTHHHRDHVDGLSVIQKSNPDAVLMAHENTMHRIGKDDWSLGYTAVKGSEEIYVRDQQFQVVFAPGHTDGHMALLHVNTHALIVGDHCVGQGSSVLDMFSGGNMADYFDTTYRFLELSPNALIPMHGRTNMWPKHMLCDYLKNRKERESSVLKAINNGATTLFEIVSTVYKDVDCSLWLPASSNVRLHVEHLAQQKKLPEGFSLSKFQSSCRLLFAINWIRTYTRTWLSQKITSPAIMIPLVVACFAGVYFGKKLPALRQ